MCQHRKASTLLNSSGSSANQNANSWINWTDKSTYTLEREPLGLSWPPTWLITAPKFHRWNTSFKSTSSTRKMVWWIGSRRVSRPKPRAKTTTWTNSRISKWLWTYWSIRPTSHNNADPSSVSRSGPTFSLKSSSTRATWRSRWNCQWACSAIAIPQTLPSPSQVSSTMLWCHSTRLSVNSCQRSENRTTALRCWRQTARSGRPMRRLRRNRRSTNQETEIKYL